MRAAHAGVSTVDKITQQLNEFDHASVDSQRAMSTRLIETIRVASHAERQTLRHFSPSVPIDSIRALVWYDAAVYFGMVDRHHLSLRYCLKALPLLEHSNDVALYSYCLNQLAMAYYNNSDFTNCLSILQKCMDLDKKNNNTIGVALDYNNVASIYDEMGQSQKGVNYILESLRYCKSVTDTDIVAEVNGTACQIYLNLKDYDRALSYANYAYNLEIKKGDDYKAAVQLVSKAAVLTELGRLTEAENYLLEAIIQFKAHHDMALLYDAYERLGDVYLKNNKFDTALHYYSLCAAYYQRMRDFNGEMFAQMGIYRSLKNSDPTRAMAHLERCTALKDSIYNHQLEDRLSEYNAIFDNNKLREANRQATQDRQVIITIGLLCIVVLLSLIVVMAVIIRMRRRKLLMQKEQEEMKDRFFTNISHEYRTPLTIIQMAAQAIADCGINGIAEIHHHASVIQRQANSLLNLVNGILDLSRLQSHAPRRLKWKRGDLVPFVNMVIDSFSEMAKRKKIDIVYHHPQETQVVDFIPSEMQRILVNIIANSLKYTKDEKRIDITTDLRGNNLTIVVADQGIGMSPEDQKHAFSPFYRSSESSGSVGSGIGLSLVKLCVEAMDGTIELQSQLGVGTTFTIHFDSRHDSEEVEEIVPESYQPVVTDQSDEPELIDGVGDEQHRTLLIVEDSTEVAHYTAAQLAGDYRIYFATSGEVGLKKATDIVPDLIITDVMMPGMDGFEFCKRIRQSDLLNHIPIIIISARATDESRIEGIKAGADAYLTKPFNREELHVMVENLLEQRDRLRQKYAQAFKEGTEDDNQWPEADRKFIAEAYKQVEQLMEERNINVNTLAEKLCMSSRQLQRRIMSVTGQTPSAFILQLRIKHAKNLLAQGYSISETAYACGFDEASNFSRAFKRATNLSPSQFVKENSGNKKDVG